MSLRQTPPGKIAVLIGENGSGKSTRLNTLSKEYISEGRDVIAIANSIHDKFRSRSKRFNLLGHRSGRKVSLKTVKKAFLNISNEDLLKTKRIGQILEYVGYEPEIGFNFVFLKDVRKYELEESDFLDNEERYELSTLLNKLYHNEFSGIHWVGLEDFSFNKVNSSTVTRLLKFEKTLRKLGAISEVEILLKKNGQVIDLMDASSGELSFITSLMFISTAITNQPVILIDEPENSLHPKWQKEYLTKIMDIFFYHEPTVICATHSPLVVSGAESSEGQQLYLYKSDRFGVHRAEVKSGNLEQILWDVFGVATPENRFFSQLIMSKLNALAENRASLDSVKSFLEELVEAAYEEKQKSMLVTAISLAKKIEDRKS
ncbi:AAA family ATPase [Vibrio lentus]|nr:AAA family ATPase [Vibrio lentus]PMH97535.1 hypothetical protein BCU54_06325 [Vibrio lentus]